MWKSALAESMPPLALRQTATDAMLLDLSLGGHSVGERMSFRGNHTRSIGQYVADAVRALPGARRLWIQIETNGFTVWLLTDAISLDDERPFYAASALLEETVLDADVRFDLVNPRHYPNADPAQALPYGVVEIPLCSE